MPFADVAAAANRAVLARFGVPVDYRYGKASRRITAAPGDVTESAIDTGRGIELRQTCQWLVKVSDIEGISDKRRGAAIVQPEQPDVAWTVESASPDMCGWTTLSTVASRIGSLGAQGVEGLQ